MSIKIQNALKNLLIEVDASEDLIKCFDVTSKVYHYTNLNTLTKIIDNVDISNGIMLSNAEFLNDKVEIGHGRKIVEEYIKNLELDELSYKKISDNIKKDDFCFYVACFSKSINLDQWRHYSDDGEGICIEFDLTGAENYFEQLMINNPNNPPFISPVIYSDTLKQEFVRSIYKIILLSRKSDNKFINKHIEYPIGKFVAAQGIYSALTMSMPILGAVVGLGGLLYDVIKENNGDRNEKERRKIGTVKQGIKELGKSLEIDESLTEIEAFSKSIPLYFPILKHNAFHTEDEIRLVYYDKNKSTLKTKLKYRASNGVKIIPYISSEQLLNAAQNVRLPISNIFLGPKNWNNETLQKSIKFFLENNGYSNVDVKFSDSPYQK